VGPKLLINTNNNTAVELSKRGHALFNSRNYKEAIKYYSKSLDINPNDPFTWLAVGRAYNALSMYGEGSKCYIKAISMDPKNEKLWYLIGMTYYNIQFYDLAIKFYDVSLAINPNNNEVRQFKKDAIDALFRTKGGQGNIGTYFPPPEGPSYPPPSGGLISKKVEVMLNDLGMSTIIGNI
jgi:tetratricopeptide (TPR) repeat protein